MPRENQAARMDLARELTFGEIDVVCGGGGRPVVHVHPGEAAPIPSDNAPRIAVGYIIPILF
jgi:hypothetical protein